MSEAASTFNATNRGVYIADNLHFLRSLNDESVDLICIDPPFAKAETFAADQLKPALTAPEQQNERRLLESWGIFNGLDAERAGIEWPDQRLGGYKDIWSWEADIHEDWLRGLNSEWGSVAQLIEFAQAVEGDDIAAYLCYMAVRIIEVHRVLKSTGSLYLHCDDTANVYLRGLLSSVFGPDQFRQKVVWGRSPGRTSGKGWGRTHDTILFYTKSSDYVWNDTLVKSAEGRAVTVPLTAAGVRRGESGTSWRGYNPTNIGRHWAVPRSGRLADWIESEVHTGFKSIESLRSRLEVLDSVGLLHWSESGTPSIRRPAEADAGRKINDVWTDIKLLSPTASERTGYPTQKPVQLAERMIAASSNPGDVVLDCFAGCASVGVAAERLGRRWLACDINVRAWTVFKRQFTKASLILLRCNDETVDQQVLGNEPVVTVHGPNNLPLRTTAESETEPKPFRPTVRKFKVPSSIIPEAEMLESLLALSGFQAWCCGYANRMPDGTVVRTTRNFHLDHVDPKSRHGSNDIPNRAPLCPYHNTRKGNRRVHLSDYREGIAHAGEMMVDTMDELIDLSYAHHEALQIYARAYARSTVGAQETA